jgi:glucose/arabinose dehydrogenase
VAGGRRPTGTRRRRALLVAGVALAAIALGAGIGLWLGDDDGTTPSRAATDRPCGRPYVEVLAAPPDPDKAGPRAELVGRVEEPSDLAFVPGDGDDGVLASRTGEVRRLDEGRIVPEVVLDLRADTAQEGDGGLLGVAYDPEEPWLYVYRTTRDQDEELTAYPVDSDGVPDPDGERLVLGVEHGPSEQHHGGGLRFGPDGHLYLGLGDGGGLGDPQEHGQDPTTLLGKVLRIDPTPDGDQPYDVPADNPFVGDDGRRPEIWALGVRNPFRIGFDHQTGDLWVGDVGQSCWEELNRIPAGRGGANLGWDVREGNQVFEGGPLTDGSSLEPELQYAHRAGWCAIVVGDALTGGGVPHTDYCRGRLMVLQPAAGGAAPVLEDTGIRVERPIAIVQAPDRSLWILSLDGGVHRVVD